MSQLGYHNTLQPQPSKSLLPLIRKQKQSIPVPNNPNHRIPPMKPHRMLIGPEPPKMPVQIVAEIVTSAQNQQRQNTRKLSRLLPIIVIDNKAIDQSPHSTAHTEWTEDERPHDFVEEVASAGHDEDADGEEDEFCDEGIYVEEDKRAKVDGAALLSHSEVFVHCYDGLVGGWK